MVPAGSAAGDYILLGRVAKPHGIRGEVKIYPFSGQPENFLAYGQIFISLENDAKRIPYSVKQARVQGKMAVLKLEGCVDRNEAEALVGFEVWLKRGDLPALDKNEYYWADLVDKLAHTEDGRELGRVTGILDTGAHDTLSVTGEGHEYLIPIREEFIVRVDEQEVVLRLPPGLLEINKS